MSVRVMAMVWQNGPKDAADTLMLLALADHSDDEGVAWPSMIRLAHKCRVTERTARRSIRRLEDEGWVSSTPGGGTRGSHGITNRYQIELSRLSTRTPTSVLPESNPDVERTNPDAHVPPTRTPTSGEPSVEPSDEPSNAVVTPVTSEDNRRPSRPTSLPRGWEPSPEVRASLEKRFGKDIEIDAVLDRFVPYYIEHSEKTSTNWSARFAQWCAKDAADVRERRPDPNGPDENGIPKWLHKRMNGPRQEPA